MIDFINKRQVNTTSEASANSANEILTSFKQSKISRRNKSGKKYIKKKLTKENKKFLKIIGLLK